MMLLEKCSIRLICVLCKMGPPLTACRSLCSRRPCCGLHNAAPGKRTLSLAPRQNTKGQFAGDTYGGTLLQALEVAISVKQSAGVFLVFSLCPSRMCINKLCITASTEKLSPTDKHSAISISLSPYR